MTAAAMIVSVAAPSRVARATGVGPRWVVVVVAVVLVMVPRLAAGPMWSRR
ncbi:hypothetical protein KIPE111705_15405 [Kibdelosporangium persicum]